MSIYKSIAKNYASNSIGLGINFLNQIVMVPLFISLWGVTKYADWILIAAFSSFFTMADMGLNTYTTNEFVVKYQQKEYFTCLKLWANTFLYITVVGGVIILLSVIIAFTAGFKGLLQVSVFSGFETSLIFILLLTKIFMAMCSGTYHGVFRSVSYTHVSNMIENAVKFFEVLILFVGIWCEINVLIIVAAYLVPVCISIIYKHIYVRRWFKLKFSFKLIDLPLLKTFVKPSAAFMLMPLGYAISNQGMIFVVNALLGPIVLVLFTTTRTLVNFLRAVMNLLAWSMCPEISVAYGKKNLPTISRLYHRSFIITFVLSLVCIVLLIFFGEPIYLVWIRHAMSFESGFFYAMLVVLLVSCLWSIAAIIPLSTNNHNSFTVAFLITQLGGIGMTYVALNIYPDLAIIPVMLFIEEAFLLWFVMKGVNKLLNSNFGVFKREIPREVKFIIKNINSLLSVFIKRLAGYKYRTLTHIDKIF
jgi:O-antigen/teichoic acid export membrane protein